MIILICGPSGSGKTTLLSALNRCCRCTVIAVRVSRKKPRRVAEIGRDEVDASHFRDLKSELRFQYECDGSLYGFSMPQNAVGCDKYAFIDYPGEYPACSELRGIPWRGVLVLPPDRQTLEKRLIRHGKKERRTAALLEYFECLHELNQGLFCKEKWRIYVSRDRETLNRFVAEATAGQLFD